MSAALKAATAQVTRERLADLRDAADELAPEARRMIDEIVLGRTLGGMPITNQEALDLRLALNAVVGAKKRLKNARQNLLQECARVRNPPPEEPVDPKPEE